MADDWREQRNFELWDHPYIIQLGDASNCSYCVVKELDRLQRFDDTMAVAHLLSMGGLMHMHHTARRKGYESLVHDIDCHEWWTGVRLVAVRGDGELESIHPGFGQASNWLKRYWRDLLRPTRIRTAQDRCHALVRLGKKNWFTQYPKQGESMDTGEPEFPVTSIEPVGEVVHFDTVIGGYHGFVRYGAKEAQRVLPEGANAYKFLDAKILYDDGSPTRHRLWIKPFRVEVDYSQRLIRAEQLEQDFDLMMSLIEKSLNE
jgi:hypothetical protein